MTMPPILIAFTVFLCVICGVLLGARIREKLPEHHVAGDAWSVNTVRLCASLMATLVAISLGLLLASAHNTFRAFNHGLEKIGAYAITMDRSMANYGPETYEARVALRQELIGLVMTYWPEDKDKLTARTTSAGLADIQDKTEKELSSVGDLRLLQTPPYYASTYASTAQNLLLKLNPKDDAQRWQQSMALDLSGKLAEERWLITETLQVPLSALFLVVLVSWLIILFTAISVFTPRNKTVLILQFLCVFAVSSTIFLILGLNQPNHGLLKASSAAYLKAIELLGSPA
jgi:hypothetical protein